MFTVANLLNPAILAAGDPPKPGPELHPGSSYTTFYSTAISPVQYGIAVGVLSVVIVAFISMIIYSTRARRAVGLQYQSPIALGRFVLYIATASYLVLLGKFLFGYTYATVTGGGAAFIPNQMGLLNVPIRYVDWAVTVPLLVLELLTISSLRNMAGARLRAGAMGAAFLMIVFGYIGGVAIDTGHNLTARLGFGAISFVFFVIVYAILIRALRATVQDLAASVGIAYRKATLLLMIVWFIYPIVYTLTGFFSTSNWIIGYQIALAVADMLAKIGFGLLVLRVARARTVADLAEVAAARGKAVTN